MAVEPAKKRALFDFTGLFDKIWRIYDNCPTFATPLWQKVKQTLTAWLHYIDTLFAFRHDNFCAVRCRSATH